MSKISFTQKEIEYLVRLYSAIKSGLSSELDYEVATSALDKVLKIAVKQDMYKRDLSTSGHTKILIYDQLRGDNPRNLQSCHKCGLRFNFDDKIVIKRATHTNRRYHFNCAKKLNIV